MEKQAAANNGIPFAALFHRSGANRYAFGFIDQLTETDLSCTLSEATRCYHFHWRKPLAATPLAATPGTTSRWQETLFRFACSPALACGLGALS